MKIFLLIILFSQFNSILAQKQGVRFKHYTTDDGLPQNMVDCILKDSKGFMWFGTWNGLTRFDGYTFTVFKQNNKVKNSLSDNFIHSLCEDDYGNIWIGTNRGLNVFLYKEEKFAGFFNHRDNRPITSNRINSIVKDNEGRLWIGTDNGIDIVTVDISGTIEEIEHFSKKKNLDAYNIQTIYKDGESLIWIGSDSGLVRYDLISGSVKKIKSKTNDNTSLLGSTVYTIFRDRKGFLWIGTNLGLNRMDETKDRFTRYVRNPFDANSLAHNSILSIEEDPNGNLMIGTLGGLSIFNYSAEKFTNYFYQLNSSSGLNNDFINCIYPDNVGNIWIGTERGGINKFNIYQKYFEFFEHEPGNKNSLSHKTVNSIWEDDEFIWIGTAGGGLNKYDKKRNTYEHYREIANDPYGLPIDFITCLYGDKSGNLWIGTWGGGLHKLTSANRSKGVFIHYRPNSSDSSSLINDFVSSITEDKLGNLWIGTLGGLDKFFPESGKFEHVTSTFGSNLVNQVGCLQFDRENNLWAGTIEGLFKIYADAEGDIDPVNCKLDYFINNPTDENSISGNYVISICSDKNGILWFGTYGNGINKLILDTADGSKNKFINYTEDDGLSNNVVYGILEDENGLLWLSTDNGLSLFNPQTDNFRNFYADDGIQNNQFYWSAYYKNKNGKLYFGGMNGLNTFYPGKITNYKSEPTTIITDFKIYNESVEVDKEYFGRVILDKTIAHTDRIVISYKAREFGFEFSALEFDQPEKITYSYNLKGFDDKWTNVDANRRYANYTGLKGGEYIFQVKSINEEGKVQSRPTELKIKIIPPFWATLWFKLILTFFLVGLIISYNRYRVYSLQKQKRKLETLVKKRTIQIEEQKEELITQAENLKDSNLQLEKRKEEVEGQKLQLEKQNEEILEQRDKLIELNKKIQIINQQQLKFFTHISHEFRTPLTLISTPIEQMITETKEDNSFKRKLQLVFKNTQRLLHLINQLMEIRKVETGKIEFKTAKNDIVKFIKNITQSFTELAEHKKIKYDFVSEFEALEVFFDNDKIENIIYNLLSNAFKYTKEQGKIALSISHFKGGHELQGAIPVVDRHHGKNTESDKYISISISDSGIGIEQSHIRDIFRRFYRISNQSDVKGTGIGLFLVKELVKAHKGMLYVKSSTGEGSIFTVVLPVEDKYHSSGEMINEVVVLPEKNMKNVHVQVLAEQLMNSHQPNNIFEDIKIAAAGDMKKPLLLLIDDDYDMLSVTSGFLISSFRIITADNGNDGINKANKYQPDLIISDIMMPEMDGLELCNLLKSNIATSHIPIILLTARSEVDDYIEGMESGADDYISKPFNAKILEAKSKSLIENRTRLKKLFSQSLIPIPKEFTTNRTDENFLQKTIKLVENNINDPEFGVQKLASEMCISRSLLHKKLTTIVDLSANDFITSMRLKKSALLLLQGNLNVSEVAFEVGFNDPKYFSRCFKRHYGVSPSEYTNGKNGNN